ncbi:MAG: prephenate dehydrogenase dimerization domain-containing protein, partial [Acholeplasmataceae bacterium]
MLGYPSESHKFTGDSFRDLTRIANINEKLWTELFLSNQKDLLDAMDIFKKHLNALEKTVKNNDQETLMELLRLSRKKRKDFENDPA